MKIAIYSLTAHPFSPSAVAALPFGEAEKARLCAIRNSKHAEASLGALLALQALVGNEPAPIIRTPAGKPCFEAPNAPAFSLSHAANFAVAAVAAPNEGRIGVDIERISPLPHATRIAKRFFTDAEREHFAANPSPEVFFAIWTAKEATAKRDGIGLSTLWAEKTPVAEHLCRFRIVMDKTEAILAVATDAPHVVIEWLNNPTMRIYKL